MATMVHTHSFADEPPWQFPWLKILLLAVAFAAASSAHALARHGEQAREIERCSNNADPSQLLNFYDSVTGFHLEFCPMPGGGYGLSVNKPDGGNITRYIPRWATSVKRIFEKMTSRQCFAVAVGVEGCWVPAEKVSVP